MEATQKKSIPSIMPEYFGLSEHKENYWIADVPVAATLEQIMEPSYWAHVAEQMTPLDPVKVRWEDGSQIAFLHVRMCERNYAKMVLDHVVKMDADMSVPISSVKHKVEWKGPMHRWSVIRLSDSQMLHDGERTKEVAYAWMREHEKSMER